MNANHVYIIIGVAALTALLSTLILYLMGTEDVAIVGGVTGGVTAVTIARIVQRNGKKSDD
jgi:hypothetical protein